MTEEEARDTLVIVHHVAVSASFIFGGEGGGSFSGLWGMENVKTLSLCIP